MKKRKRKALKRDRKREKQRKAKKSVVMWYRKSVNQRTADAHTQTHSLTQTYVNFFQFSFSKPTLCFLFLEVTMNRNPWFLSHAKIWHWLIVLFHEQLANKVDATHTHTYTNTRIEHNTQQIHTISNNNRKIDRKVIGWLFFSFHFRK